MLVFKSMHCAGCASMLSLLLNYTISLVVAQHTGVVSRGNQPAAMGTKKPFQVRLFFVQMHPDFVLELAFENPEEDVFGTRMSRAGMS